MGDKLGRNDPCWCGSGVKYKKCHIDREAQEPLKPWAVDTELRKIYGTNECLAAEALKIRCSKVVIKAHTVPKSGSLKQIARKGHVYSFVPGFSNLTQNDGRLLPQLVGINRASAFTGFCSFHDSTIFSKIENQPFVASSEQCFLLAYRALAREIYTKKALVSSSDFRRHSDRGKSPEQQRAIQMMNSFVDIGASAGLSNGEHHKAEYDKILLTQDLDAVRAYIIELDSPPPIMCSAGTFPEQDFNGNQLQDLGDLNVTPQLLNFTSFYGSERGAIVFTWLAESDPVCRPFIDSLKALPNDRTTDGLIRFFFESCENLHIQPKWWETLEGSKRDLLVERLSVSADPLKIRDPRCLAEDGVRFDNWPISSSTTIEF